MRSQAGDSRPAASSSVRTLALAFAAAALLGTQAIGLVHRVEHGGAGGWIDGAGDERRQHAGAAARAGRDRAIGWNGIGP